MVTKKIIRKQKKCAVTGEAIHHCEEVAEAPYKGRGKQWCSEFENCEEDCIWAVGCGNSDNDQMIPYQ